MDFDVILVELLDRVQSPKSNKFQLYTTHILLLFTGWLIKLWECVKSDGIVIINSSYFWDKNAIFAEIGKW